MSHHHVTWDEKTIALHDADRGTRMKIDEPKTPYHHHDAHDHERLTKSEGVKEGPALSWDRLQEKLEKVQDEQEDSSSEEGETTPRKVDEKEKARFAEKRKQHYNEFERVQQWRQQHHHDDDEEEEEEDEAKETAKPVV